MSFSLDELASIPTDLPPSAPPHPNPLPSVWTASWECPLANAGAHGDLPSEADVVVIGSGFTGTSAAARIVEDLVESKGEGVVGLGEGGKVRVVVLEAREFCSGATARNGGHCTPSYPITHFASNTKSWGLDNARKELALEMGGAAWVITNVEEEGWDVDLVKGGNIQTFDTKEEFEWNKGEILAAKAAGEDTSYCQFYSAEEAKELFGAACAGAIRIPGNNLYPRKLVTAIFHRAQAQAAAPDSPVSLALFTNAPVVSVTPSNSNFGSWDVNTAVGSIKTRFVIHATNAYASHLLPHLAAGKYAIVPTRGQIVAYQPAQGGNPHWSAGFGGPLTYHFQRQGGGPVILGGFRQTEPKEEFGNSDDSSVSPLVSAGLRSYLPSAFPKWFSPTEGGLEGDVQIEWTGVMAYRKTGVPLVGHVFVGGEKQAGQFISAGYTGHGMPRCQPCGSAVGGMVLDELKGRRSEVPEWLPGHYESKAGGSDWPRDGREKSGWFGGWCGVM